MPYKTGSWGEKAKKRSKERLQYFKKYHKKRYNNLKSQIIGCNIPKDIVQQFIEREKILKCQLCRIERKPIKYKGLLIHHKDENVKNNNFDNLMILCRTCHNRIHGNLLAYNRQKGGKNVGEHRD